jgi:PKD repeat protein
MRSRKAVVAVVLLMIIVPGGIVVGLTRLSSPEASMASAPSTQGVEAGPGLASLGSTVGSFGAANGIGSADSNSNLPVFAGGTTTTVTGAATVTMTLSTSTVAAPASGSTSVVRPNSQQPESSQGPSAPFSPASTSTNGSRDIEFFTNVTLQAASALAAFTRASAIAYSVGGYVSDSTESNTTALVVIRVPAANYEGALTQVEGLGTLVTLSSSSNDVTVQYTDLNATLTSLQAEQASLLAILSQSTNINSTLSVESRVQGVDQQINSVQSEILQTKTLVSYATISALIEERAPSQPLALKLTATPRTGNSPLSVTFNAVVKGGEQPYIVNYNFGDGSSYEGQALIHTFGQPGRYNVTVTATDASANVTQAWTVVNVSPAPAGSALGSFPNFVGGLFLQVVEGIIEVAVVVVPVATALLVVLFPLRHRLGLSSRPARHDDGADKAPA